MQFEIIETKTIADGSKRIVVKIPLKELIYFGYILESFEGWCNFTTIDKQKHLVQIDSCPDFEIVMDKLLETLKKWRIK